jgi:hypothetical protein
MAAFGSEPQGVRTPKITLWVEMEVVGKKAGRAVSAGVSMAHIATTGWIEPLRE